ncbi:unnamed protein product, partial [Allacma fusca]
MDGVFHFTDENGQSAYFGPLLKVTDVERILVEKLNVDVQSTRNVVEGTNAAIEELSEKMGGLLISLDANVTILKDKFERSESVERSHDLENPPTSMKNSQISQEPYVNVPVGEKDYPYFMSHNVWSQISGSEIPRTIARVVLESLHSLEDLRGFTLTGKGLVSRTEVGALTSTARVRKQLPPESLAIAQAVVVKTLRTGMLRKFEDKFN